MQSILEEDRHSAEFNWLVVSTSAYLKQYETEMINWLECCEVAFDKAKREGKLVFLTIGQMSCKHCKDLHDDLFNDEEIAGLLNENFISMILDKDEHPDLSDFYETMYKKSHKNVNFPLTIFLTPNKEPIYFVLKEKIERQWFKELLSQLYPGANVRKTPTSKHEIKQR